MKKTDEEHLQEMFEVCSELLDAIHSGRINIDLLEDDLITQWAISTPLMVVGEHANSLSKVYVEANPEIEWDNIAGLRHRLIHNYEGTNWIIISHVLENDLPKLLDYLNHNLQA